MADKFAGEVVAVLNAIDGVTCRSDPTAKYATDGDPGRADLVVIHGGKAEYVEIKNGDGLPASVRPGNKQYYVWDKKNKRWKEKKHAGMGFDLTHWRKNQREWAETYGRGGKYQTEVWIALAMGIDPPSRDPERVNKATGLHWMPRKLWLIPYPDMINIDRYVRQYQNRLPYRVMPGMLREIQDNNISATTLLRPFELTRSRGIWTIPVSHEFYKRLIGTPARPLVTETVIKELPCTTTLQAS